jgi:hypothetical protein
MECLNCASEDVTVSIVQTNLVTDKSKKVYYCDKNCFHAHQRDYHAPILQKQIDASKQINKVIKSVWDQEPRLKKLYSLNFADILFVEALLARKPKDDLYKLREAVVKHRKILFQEMEDATYAGTFSEGSLLLMADKFKPETSMVEENWIEFFGV